MIPTSTCATDRGLIHVYYHTFYIICILLCTYCFFPDHRCRCASPDHLLSCDVGIRHTLRNDHDANLSKDSTVSGMSKQATCKQSNHVNIIKHICKRLKQHLIVLFDFKELIYTASFSSLLTMTVWFPCWFGTSVSTPWAQQSYLFEGSSEWRCVSM